MQEDIKLITPKDLTFMGSISIAYLLMTSWLIGFKTDQLVLIAFINTLYFSTLATRKFVIAYAIFIFYWVLFDSMKAFPNYWFNKVHIQDLYLAEKSIFGIISHGVLLTPNEFAELHAISHMDLLAGLFYLTWVPVPLGFGFYLYLKNKEQFLEFALSFMLVNLIGFVIYYLYPAAPPWYVKEFGFDFIRDTKGNTAGLSRFDALTGVQIFTSLYSKSSNVFAAMPSLHSAYPVIVLYYGLKNKVGWVNVIFAVLMIGIWSSAIYSGHHYVLDVLAGIACALVSLILFQKVLLKTHAFNRFLQSYKAKIS